MAKKASELYQVYQNPNGPKVSTVSRKILEPISICFVVLLIGFMVFVSFYDVKKLVTPAVKSLRTPKSLPAAVEKPADAAPAQNK